MIIGWALITWAVIAAALLAWAIHKRAIEEAAMGPCRFCGIRRGPGFFIRGEIGELVRAWLNYQPADCLCDECWAPIEKVYRRRMHLRSEKY